MFASLFYLSLSLSFDSVFYFRRAFLTRRMKRGNKKCVLCLLDDARKVPRKRTTMMNIASFFARKGRRMFRRDECDAHFAFTNVAKSTQRCVFDDDDVLSYPSLVEDLFLSSLL